MGNLVELKLLGITFSQLQAGAYALILIEKEGKRRMPVIIGTPEAQSIAIFLENLNPPRPLTHDLFTTFMNVMDVELKEVIINKYSDGVFYSELVISNGEKLFYLDARTSDAIALAIRSNARIYTNEEVLEETGISTLNDDDVFDNLETTNDDVYIEDNSVEELQKSLDEALANENYEKASFLRDLINKKSSQ
ncbi:bifunctional DNase/RNase [Dysgonomonadaceae bacterium PH5-43]|nr:bifunctional DNase/RNase [Dysgonomonadaceae bacterium PH5-43]